MGKDTNNNSMLNLAKSPFVKKIIAIDASIVAFITHPILNVFGNSINTVEVMAGTRTKFKDV